MGYRQEAPSKIMSNTPRTDAEHAKTLTPAYEYVGAEGEAWEWARTLEKELIEALARPKPPQWGSGLDWKRPEWRDVKFALLTNQ